MTACGKILLKAAGAVLLLLVVLVLALKGLSAKYLKAEIEKALGNAVQVKNIEVGFGGITITVIKISREAETAGQIDKVSVKAELLGFLKKDIAISDVSVQRPSLSVLINKKGQFQLPVAFPASRRDEKSDEKTTTRTSIRHIGIEEGRVKFSDRHVRPGVNVDISNVKLDMENVQYPSAGVWTSYNLSGETEGHGRKGSIVITGKTDFRSESTKAIVVLKSIDLVPLRPYFEKKGDMEIVSGCINASADVTINGGRILAPGRLVIIDLVLKQGGTASSFWGVPSSLVLNILKTGSNEIPLDFVIEGDLDNPHFHLRDNLLASLSSALAEKTGRPFKNMGNAVLEGGSGIVRKTERAIKGLFK